MRELSLQDTLVFQETPYSLGTSHKGKKNQNKPTSQDRLMGCTETPVFFSKCLPKLSLLTSQPPPVQADSQTVTNVLTPPAETVWPQRTQLPALSL